MLGDLAKLADPVSRHGNHHPPQHDRICVVGCQCGKRYSGIADGVAFIRNPENKTQVTRSLAKGLRLKRVEDADEGYQSMLDLYEKKIYPSVDGVRNVIRLLGAGNEKIRRLKAEELVDDSVVKRLEREGRF